MAGNGDRRDRDRFDVGRWKPVSRSSSQYQFGRTVRLCCQCAGHGLLSASNALREAMIGGSRGLSVAKEFRKAGFDVSVVCDVDEAHLRSALKRNWKRKLLTPICGG